ncbi:heterokaryon incompatibility protein-domain-containing protein [Paraphoma chrysanthemicola]|nr:heterokaryon incompatibility protein-domain-containing protein [Paraphoma chrysanthemicola]
MLCFQCETINFKFVYELPENSQRQVRSVAFSTYDYWAQGSEAEYYYYHVLHERIQGLIESVEWGCQLCNLLYTAFAQPPRTSERKCVDVTQATKYSWPVVLRVWASRRRKPFAENILSKSEIFEAMFATIGNETIELRFLQGLNGLARASFELGTMLQEVGSYEEDLTNGSKQSLELLRQWLDECKANHPQCDGLNAPLPTRVIDVGTTEEDAPLVIETTPGQGGDYIALSHCWGRPELHEETRTWASDPHNLYPLAKWPLTFQQVAHIANTLGIRYLWIDIACIKQGDESDFAREAPKMAEYYSGATLVVAATHAEDSRKGCFVTRSPLLHRPCPVPFRLNNEETLFVRLDEKKKSQATEPLRSRAWCFQEILLSRRTASFQADQLYWSCLHTKASEDDPKGVSVENSGPQAQPLVFLRTFLHHPPGGGALLKSLASKDQELIKWQKTMESLYSWNKPYPKAMNPTQAFYRNPAYQKWYDCVEYFMECKITYERDVLPAMSGLAKKMHGAVGINDSYCAGLWTGDLVRGLLWMVLSPASPIKKSNYIAPTWSWASRVGQRISSFFDEAYMCDPYTDVSPNWRELMAALEPRRLHVEMEFKHPNAEYGEVTAGLLRCSVRLLHGGKIAQLLRGQQSIYGAAHPAYHRGLGGMQLDHWITNWRLTVPAEWAVEADNGTDSPPPTEVEGEITLDDFSVAHLLSTKQPFAVEKEISVLLLWPFKFNKDRCIGIGLVREETGKNEYKRVGRVEFAIPYQKLWAWAQSNTEYDDIIIV